MAFRDERREAVAELLEETRIERELRFMCAILDADACLDRLSQIWETDDFEEEANEAMNAALLAESDENETDYENAVRLAEAVIENHLAEYFDAEAR